MRLIDADDLTVRLAFLFDLLANGEMEKLTTTEILEFIEEQPTINPVKHGQWIERSKDDNRCSLCGWGVWVNTNNYCPNCGAKMDEVEE